MAQFQSFDTLPFDYLSIEGHKKYKRRRCNLYSHFIFHLNIKKLG